MRVMKSRLLLFLLMGLSFSLIARNYELSPSAEISIITCDPGQEALYAAFGHSAIRINDPVLGIDLAYNYGVFDFNQPNFYLNFTRGHLIYKLSVQDARRLN